MVIGGRGTFLPYFPGDLHTVPDEALSCRRSPDMRRFVRSNFALAPGHTGLARADLPQLLLVTHEARFDPVRLLSGAMAEPRHGHRRLEAQALARNAGD